MRRNYPSSSWRGWAALAAALAACSPSSGPQVGSQTNWMRTCDTSRECGAELSCLCGACTTPCETESVCDEFPGASCVLVDDPRAVAFCGGEAPPRALCLPPCQGDICADGSSCIAGICTPMAEEPVSVEIDVGVRHQALIGFGAGLVYESGVIVDHPRKAELYDAMFLASGFGVMRVLNRWPDDTGHPARVAEIIEEAEARLGRRPVVIFVSGSPPADLKANASRSCEGDAATCTLTELATGGFDYVAFADYLRASLESYASAGIEPDYVSIQNNPNWSPPAGDTLEACRFLPEEGTTTLTVDGASVEVTYPGYRQALEAVRERTSDLPVVPRFVAPDVTGIGGVPDYLGALEATTFEAISMHLYGVDVDAPDLTPFEEVASLSTTLDRPVFQTEMQASGLETAVLIHHSLTAGRASVYLQNNFGTTASSDDPVALLSLTADAFSTEAPYHALVHYAHRTGPEWVRVDARSEGTLLGSAWLSPDEDALTVVLVNPGSTPLDAELELPDGLRASLAGSEVTRTVFGAIESSASLGELPALGAVRLPAGSMVTVALFVE